MTAAAQNKGQSEKRDQATASADAVALLCGMKGEEKGKEDLGTRVMDCHASGIVFYMGCGSRRDTWVPRCGGFRVDGGRTGTSAPTGRIGGKREKTKRMPKHPLGFL